MKRRTFLGTTLATAATASLSKVAFGAPLAPFPLFDTHAHFYTNDPDKYCTISEPEAFMAEIHRVRSQGWAMVDQELEEGLRSLAVPVHDSKGEVVAAINVSVHASRWSLEAVRKQLLPRLLETAAAVERDSHAAATV